MLALLHNRLIRSYSVLLLGMLLFVARRWVLPLEIEQGLPFDIATSTVLNLCYLTAHPVPCADPLLVVLTVVGLVVAVGWGSRGMLLFTLILMPLPLFLYFSFGPLWLVFLYLLAIPAAMELGLRWLFPPTAATEE
ncbi:MAG: hypothetical protein MUD01_16305 [Chloroflexaceae bacterium]|nr:hypothetical protein [Chloroflexaceae bacterium]